MDRSSAHCISTTSLRRHFEGWLDDERPVGKANRGQPDSLAFGLSRPQQTRLCSYRSEGAAASRSLPQWPVFVQGGTRRAIQSAHRGGESLQLLSTWYVIRGDGDESRSVEQRGEVVIGEYS